MEKLNKLYGYGLAKETFETHDKGLDMFALDGEGYYYVADPYLLYRVLKLFKSIVAKSNGSYPDQLEAKLYNTLRRALIQLDAVSPTEEIDKDDKDCMDISVSS